MRKLLLPLAAVLALALASSALAAPLTATDSKSGVSFSLDGNTLTLSQATAPTESAQLRAACIVGVKDLLAYNNELLRDFDGAPWEPTSAFFTFAVAALNWEAGSLTATGTFRTAPGDLTDGCVVEYRDGGDFAQVGFTADWNSDSEGGPGWNDSAAQQALMIGYKAARSIQAQRNGRYPAPRKLARLIHAIEPGFKVKVAAGVKQATATEVLYVLASSTSKRVKLAYRARNGALWTLTETKNGAKFTKVQAGS